jgi:aryl carrier-like protein
MGHDAQLEQQLHGLFATLLEVDRVGAHDDFFELGGDSLQVIKLVSRMRRILQVEVSPGDVFDHPTVAGLEKLLRTRLSNKPKTDTSTPQRVEPKKNQENTQPADFSG